MLIVNADDWGRSAAETDAALQCHQNGSVISVSAMVFMADSERAASLARENDVDTGLHLNFSEPFSANPGSATLLDSHRGVSAFLTRNKYSQLIYNPLLRDAFACSCRAQLEEFHRLYNRAPSHIDGHHHMHLCANVVLSELIPEGMTVRRHFSFWPGEKSVLNRAYRNAANWWLARRYRLRDYFFDLTQSIQEKKLDRVARLARSSSVELMTHPISRFEMDYLMGDEFRAIQEELKSVRPPDEHLRVQPIRGSAFIR
jgi:chitin disaccharide deacetylase